MSSIRTPHVASIDFQYKLNAMEFAARQERPFEAGYAAKRQAVLDHVAKLEADRSENGEINAQEKTEDVPVLQEAPSDVLRSVSPLPSVAQTTDKQESDFVALLAEFEELVLDANDPQLPRRGSLPVQKRLNEVRAQLQSFARSATAPTEMALCEISRLVLHRDQPYVFRKHAGCKGCEEYDITSRLNVGTSARPEGVPRITAEQVEWVVNDIAELGVKIGNQFFWLYKGTSLVYGNYEDTSKDGVCLHDDGKPMHWRPVFKREFGECCHPVNYDDLKKCGQPHYVGGVSLDDSDEWKPLPSHFMNKGQP